MKVIFSNKDTGNKLYISANESPGWCAYLSPSVLTETELSLKDTWSISHSKGCYVFSNNAPCDLDNFIPLLQQYINTQPHSKMLFLWIHNPDNALDAANIYKMQINETILHEYEVMDNTHFSVGEYTYLTFFAKCVVVFDEEHEHFEISENYGSEITFTNPSREKGAMVKSPVYIPFFGESRGCFRFTLAMKGWHDLSNFDAQLKYFVLEDDVLKVNPYPLISEDFNESLIFNTSIDPVNQYNNLELFRTYMAFETAPSIPTNFRTAFGYAVYLRPLVKDDSAYSSFYKTPAKNSAKFVFSPQKKDEISQKLPAYMIPQGDFFIEDSSRVRKEDTRILCGLSGTEYVICASGDEKHSGDIMSFIPYMPAFYVKTADDSEVNLLDKYLTSWVSFAQPEGLIRDIQYISQPYGAPLYHAKDDTGFLSFFDAAAARFNREISFPMLPLAGIEKPVSDFEKLVIPAARSLLIQRKAIQGSTAIEALDSIKGAFADSNTVVSTTPQGLLVEVDIMNSQWLRIILASNNSVYPPLRLEFTGTDSGKYINPLLRSSFQKSSVFTVLSQNIGNVLGSFNNNMTIEGWPFAINVKSEKTYGRYQNILIFKYCDGKLTDMVNDTEKWTNAKLFNDIEEIKLLSSWISNYLKNGIDSYREKGDKDFENFANIAQNPSWRGIIALNVDIGISDFPEQLQGLLGGINLSEFRAHHFGVNVNRVETDSQGALSMDKSSSLFGLINYVDSGFEKYNNDINAYKYSLDTKGLPDYSFKVLSLKVVFQNSKITGFGSFIEIIINKIFGSKIRPGGYENILILKGNCEHHGDTPVYIFNGIDINKLFLSDSALGGVEITKTNFVTTVNNAKTTGEIRSCFNFWGYLDFKKAKIDLLSFGTNESNAYGVGLCYSNLSLGMNFNIKDTLEKDFLFNAESMSFDITNSLPRSGSLFSHFPLQFTELIVGTDDKTPDDWGYVDVNTPDITKQARTGHWYGLVFQINMGTLGALVGKAGFIASLMAVWDGESVCAKIKIPGISSKSKSLTINGVLGIDISGIKLLNAQKQDDEGNAYMLLLNQICLKLLGLKFPSNASIDFYLFGNPNKNASSGSLGWYAAYQLNHA